MHLAELSRWRQVTYKLLSAVFLYPDQQRWQAVAGAAAALFQEKDTIAQFAFFPEWRRLLSSLVALPVQNTLELEEEYVRIFMHRPEKQPCLPYESVCLDPRGQIAGWLAARLEQEYAIAGLGLASSLEELPDHVSVELEFMAFLCSRESDAWHSEVAADAVGALELQAGFLDRHLARWFPEWALKVASLRREGVYSVAAKTARSFVSHDRDLVGILLDQFQRTPLKAQAREKAGSP